MLDRSAILHTAHDWARQDSFRHPHAHRWPSYRAALADAPRSAWAVAKCNAAQAERAAALAAEEAASHVPLPDAIARQVADLRLVAECQTLTGCGNRRRLEILAQADDLAAALQNAATALRDRMPCSQCEGRGECEAAFRPYGRGADV